MKFIETNSEIKEKVNQHNSEAIFNSGWEKFVLTYYADSNKQETNVDGIKNISRINTFVMSTLYDKVKSKIPDDSKLKRKKADEPSSRSSKTKKMKPNDKSVDIAVVLNSK